MTKPNDQFIETVDIRSLHELNWPIFRLLARSFVERLELQRYKRTLLSSGQWERIRAVPRADRPYLFDLYGLPAVRAEAASGGDARAPFPLF
jgi:hypothetical protein